MTCLRWRARELTWVTAAGVLFREIQCIVGSTAAEMTDLAERHGGSKRSSRREGIAKGDRKQAEKDTAIKVLSKVKDKSYWRQFSSIADESVTE